MMNEADNLNDAIVAKIQNILNNAECIDSMRIIVEHNSGEIPTIRYDIKELIIPQEAKNDR